MGERVLESLSANLGIKVVSVLIALLLWGVVLGSRSIEVTKDVPLEILTPGELLPANELPDRVSFRLVGPKAFLRTVLDRREDPIRVNLASAKAGSVTYRFFSDNISLPIGVKVASITPNSLLIKLERVNRREVPLQLELRGEPPEGFRLKKVELRPQTARLKGAESRIEAIEKVSTLPVDLSEVTGNSSKEVLLDLERHNVQLDGAAPRVYFEVEALEANFRIRNVDVRVLSSLEAKVKEKSVAVHVNATPEQIQTLDRTQVYGIVDLRGRPKGRYVEPVRIVLPEGVKLVKVLPEKVEITLE